MMIKRRFIQGLLILALLCGAVLLAHPSAAWAMEGTGSKDDPYQISTAEDLYWFAGLVNDGQTTANAELTADIVLNTGLDQTKFAVNDDGALTYDGDTNISFDEWTPIGNDYDYRYTGTFDGKGHTISGLYINSNAGYVGLFGCIGSGGTVKNLTLSNSYIRISRSDINTFVGGICGENRDSITNCSNSGIVNVSGGAYTYVGGICGRNNGGSIENCDNSSSDVAGTDTVGGICGLNAGGITTCCNSGDVTGTVGGICGENWGSIKGCSNIGKVTSSYGRVGGICRENNGSITNCSNSGAVSGGSGVGGICGVNYGDSIKNCDNSGDVTGTDTVGGICGYNDGGTISDCDNSGPVAGSDEVGGICGHNRGSITNCSNSGTVTVHNSSSSSTAYVGGICGYHYEGSITNCYWLTTDTAEKGVGFESGTSTNVESKTADQYASDKLPIE